MSFLASERSAGDCPVSDRLSRSRYFRLVRRSQQWRIRPRDVSVGRADRGIGPVARICSGLTFYWATVGCFPRRRSVNRGSLHRWRGLPISCSVRSSLFGHRGFGLLGPLLPNRFLISLTSVRKCQHLRCLIGSLRKNQWLPGGAFALGAVKQSSSARLGCPYRLTTMTNTATTGIDAALAIRFPHFSADASQFPWPPSGRDFRETRAATGVPAIAFTSFRPKKDQPNRAARITPTDPLAIQHSAQGPKYSREPSDFGDLIRLIRIPDQGLIPRSWPRRA